MSENWKNKLQKTFESRTIIPSENLWEKIENQLDNTPKKNNNRWWFYVAACGAIVLGIAYFGLVFNETSNKISTKVVLSESVENQINKEESAENITPMITKEKSTEKTTIPPSEKLVETNQVAEKKQYKPLISEEILSEIFPETTSEMTINTAQTQVDISPEEKLLQEIELEIRAEKLLALIEAQIKEEALLQNYDMAATQLLSEVEKENLRIRIHNFFKKMEKEIDKTALAIEEKIKSIKLL